MNSWRTVWTREQISETTENKMQSKLIQLDHNKYISAEKCRTCRGSWSCFSYYSGCCSLSFPLQDNQLKNHRGEARTAEKRQDLSLLQRVVPSPTHDLSTEHHSCDCPHSPFHCLSHQNLMNFQKSNETTKSWSICSERSEACGSNEDSDEKLKFRAPNLWKQNAKLAKKKRSGSSNVWCHRRL